MGVLIGAIISLLLLLRRGARPHCTELGRVPGTDYFADRIRHPANGRIDGVFIFRCDGALLYCNTQFVSDRFFDALDARSDGVRLVVFFLGTVPVLDLAGADLLLELHATLRGRGIGFRLAETHSGVRETLRRAGFERHYGAVEADQTVATVLHKWAGPTAPGRGGAPV